MSAEVPPPDVLTEVHGGTVITITIHLPANIDDVNAVLSAVADHWPTAKVDTSGEGGWLISLPSVER